MISVRDVENRLNLVIATSNTENTPATRDRIRPEVLRLLIDERLKRQEARRVGVTVSPQDIDRALSDVSRQIGIPVSQFPEFLESRGATMPALLDQLEAEIGWIKTVNRLADERSNVSEEEIEAEIRRIELAGGGTEYRVAEIFIAIDEPAIEPQAMALANQIVQDSRGGASFAQLARTFSQSASSEAGGDLGWVRAAQLDPRLQETLRGLDRGQIAGPIRTETGVYVFQVMDRRSVDDPALGASAVQLSQVVLPLPQQASPAQVEEQLNAARALRGQFNDCAAFAARGRELGSSLSGELGRIEVDKLPPQIRQLIAPLSPGEVSEPIRTGDGILLLMVCERARQPASDELRNSVQRRLFDQRMSSISRQTLRDLRRAAMLEVRN
ncbi:MAG: hypothetical protein HC826_00380 [Rhodospirillales bacterium]|nr:hypothetical protein [Rhodospirillales bacterium]